MTLGIVLFRTEHRRGLKYPVEHAHHHLLVELRALLQHCRSVKILQPEQIRAALGAFRSDLRCMNLRKPFTVQKITESSDHALLDAELRPLSDVAQRNRTVIQIRLQRRWQFPLGNRKRKLFRRFRQHADCIQTYLKSVRRAVLCPHGSLHLDGRRFLQFL